MRLVLITYVMSVLNYPVGVADIVFNRSTPSDLEDIITAVNPATFISDQTKCELSGVDWEIEQKRLEEQKAANVEYMDMFEQPAPVDNTDNEDNTDDINA